MRLVVFLFDRDLCELCGCGLCVKGYRDFIIWLDCIVFVWINGCSC